METALAANERGSNIWLCLTLLLLACILSGCTSALFLHPNQVDYSTRRPLDTPAQDVWIDAQDGSRLHALYLPAQAPLRGTVLHLHGNAENITSHIHLVSWLPAHGYAVLALDYRGFGQSQGHATLDAIHQDAATALAWLAAQDRAQTGALIVLGQSIGASVALRMVATSPLRAQVAAVIADSPFASYRRIAREKLGDVWLTWPLQWPLSLLICDRYASEAVIAQLAPTPLLLIHGTRDPVIADTHAQRLYARAAPPKTLWLLPDTGHIQALRQLSVQQRLLDWLSRTLPQ
ncbi:alpha/beta hydrolase [Sinimarinibacterium sp. NLF-5-8]|uniref:alpha/beta hydrolase n=1 Tax=Sinimarinibacterium sp. NLF-5-8 TaxID=2698684 RepID=UPI00137C2CE9|nr:alpha/beta hydrolase [Sinimarinibacterium sp. NLF-5-8]QHS10612.1 alpha/beta hydrolase [Sinimarinibacterium sp. NLF-5-8]